MNDNTISQDVNRDDNGKFLTRYDQRKTLRSIKLTDYAWQRLKELGDRDVISRTDVIERFTRNNKSSESVILEALDKFIEYKRLDWGNNPMQRGEFSTQSRTWDKLKEFKELIKDAPWEVLEESD